MTSKELVKQALAKWQFPILTETESAIAIRFQMNFITIGSLSDENKVVGVTLCGVFSADNAEEMFLGLRTCNEINHQLMQVKAYIDEENDLTIASEFFYQTEDDLEYLLNLALQAVVVAKKKFITRYQALEAEVKMLQELEESLDDESEED